MTNMTFKSALAAVFALSLGASAALADGVTRSGSVQGSNGRGVTYTGGGSYDPATGTYSRSGTATTNNGNTATRNTTSNCNAGDGSLACNTTATTTTGSGRTVTRDRWLNVTR